MKKEWNKSVSSEVIEKTAKALKENGMSAIIAETKEEAKQKALDFIPAGSEVMTMTSVTLDDLGIEKEINESGKYDSVKKKIFSMDHKSQDGEMRKLGASPDYSMGSAHALTEDGKIFIASNTGSQLPAYAYGAGKVIFIIGAQKIVKDTPAALERIYEYVLPLESERAKKAYGVPGSNVSKLLIINKEINPERIKVIILKEEVGF